MVTPPKRINLDIDPGLEEQVKLAAADRGISVSEYCIQAVMRALELSNIPRRPSITREWLEETGALRRKIFQGRITSDSVELIREARRERSEQVERAVRGS